MAEQKKQPHINKATCWCEPKVTTIPPKRSVQIEHRG